MASAVSGSTPASDCTPAWTPNPALWRALLSFLEYRPALAGAGSLQGQPHPALKAMAGVIARLQAMPSYPSYLLAAFAFARPGASPRGEPTGTAARNPNTSTRTSTNTSTAALDPAFTSAPTPTLAPAPVLAPTPTPTSTPAHSPTLSVTASAVAGLMLRNHILQHSVDMADSMLCEIGLKVLPILSSSSVLLRRTAATVLVALGEASVPALAMLLPLLFPLLNSSSTIQREAALVVCAKLVEDVPGRLEDVLINRTATATASTGTGTTTATITDAHTGASAETTAAASTGTGTAGTEATAKPLDALVPGWIRAMASPSVAVRVLALRSLIPLADGLSPAFEKHQDHFLAALFALTGDANPSVRKHVCQAFCTLFCIYTDKLAQHLPAVVDYMLVSTQDPDPSIALEACRFWLDAAEDASLARNIRQALPRLVPVLLSCMVYDEKDLAVLNQEQSKCVAAAAAAAPAATIPAGPSAADAAAPRNTSAGLIQHPFGPGNDETAPAGVREYTEVADGIAAYEDGGKAEDDPELLGEWSLRKCSAASLDALSVRFGTELLKPLLPLLKPKLRSADWVQREVAILALGAVAEGAYEGMRPQMPAVIPHLVEALDDAHVVVRSIACWSLGRYVRWCIGDESPAHLNKYFVPVIDGLLRTTLDPSMRLHEGACSALATLEEEAGPALVPYVHKIMVGLMQAFAASHGRGLLNVYDALTVLVDSAGAEVCKRGESDMLLAPIMRWFMILGNDDETRLVPLLECLTSIAIAFGAEFLPYAPAVFQRCVVLVADIMARYDTRLAEFPSDDARVLVMDCFDLLSGIMQALETGAAPLVAAMASSALPLLALCLRIPDSGVRQSALAFLGDTAMYTFDSLRPCLPLLLPHLVAQIDEEPKKNELSVCNNATWAIGEVALQLGDVTELRAHVPDLVARLTRVLLSHKANQSLAENAAVALGRLGLVFPAAVAPHLPVFAERWCSALWDVKDSEEKDSAYRGFCAMVATHPAAIDAPFPFVALAITRWRTPSNALNTAFAALLAVHKGRIGHDSWHTTLRALPAPVAKKLMSRYNV